MGNSTVPQRGLFLAWIFALVFVVTIFGQVPNSTTINKKSQDLAATVLRQVDQRDEKLSSKILGREITCRVVLPRDYSNSNEIMHYSVIYLLHGLAGHFDNWTDKTKLTEYAANLPFIIVMPEGGDGWYTDSATVPSDKYESYIIKELIPEIDKKFRTIADREHRVIAGLSMGGYGSIKFGLKYPELFSLVGSFSGALDAPLRGEKSDFLRPSIISVFGPDGSKTRIDNDIFNLIRNATPEKLKTYPFIYLDCGTEDSFLQTNRDFDALLAEKKLPHEYREMPGNHSWEYWDRQIQEFLRIANARQIRKSI
jgi:putative tributyrin esterase